MQVKTFSLKDGATLTAYLHTFSEEMTSSFCTARPAAIVCPGGAYMSLSDREADPPALEFAVSSDSGRYSIFFAFMKDCRYNRAISLKREGFSYGLVHQRRRI